MADDVTATADTLHGSIVAALSELVEIVADETADTGTYRYKYAPLSTIMRTIRPVLAKHGLVVSQLVSSHDGELVLTTQLVHRSGQTYGTGPLSVKLPQTPQQLGSIVSYLRRYQLVALCGLAVEDDDAKGAQSAPLAPQTHRGTSGARSARPAQLSPAQRGRIMALFGRLGLNGADFRDVRLAMTSEIVGRELASTNDVTPDEASALMEELERRVDEGGYA